MAQLIVFAGCFLLLAAAIGVHIYDRLAAAHIGARRRVLVQLHSGRAFTGLQWRRRGRLLVLRNVEMLEPNNQPTTLDGEVVLDRGEVEYVQVAG